MYMIDLIRIICKKMIDLNSNILMIDLSYYIFYRFYALCNWVKLSKTECEMKMEDVFFRKKYEKCFIENINKPTIKNYENMKMSKVYIYIYINFK